MLKVATKAPPRERQLSASDRLEELRVRDRALTEEIIRLENSGGGAASNAAREIDAAARNLITGIAIAPTPVRDLTFVTRERAETRFVPASTFKTANSFRLAPA